VILRGVLDPFKSRWGHKFTSHLRQTMSAAGRAAGFSEGPPAAPSGRWVSRFCRGALRPAPCWCPPTGEAVKDDAGLCAWRGRTPEGAPATQPPAEAW
jgi:hypothetical protein